VTRLSNEERKAVIEQFYQRVWDGIAVDRQWMREMAEASTPKLPDEPTPEQIDAWIELSELVSDPTFIENMRARAADVWNDGFDAAAYKRASDAAIRAAREALDRGVAPTAAEAAPIVHGFVADLAAASGKAADAAFVASMREKHERYEAQDPRGSRYWELVAIMNGQPAMKGAFEEWGWIVKALKHHIHALEPDTMRR
jgi:hypothetical protein